MKVISQFFREGWERVPARERVFRFVSRPLQDLHELVDRPDDHLPPPSEVHLRGSAEESILAYPVLEGAWSAELVQALRVYVREEAAFASDVALGSSGDRSRLPVFRDAFARELDRCLDSCTYSSQGRALSAVFWLYLSHHTARELGQVPRMVLEWDRKLGRSHGDRIKYQVYSRLSALMGDGNLEVNRRIASQFGHRGGEFLSRIVLQMRENVLIFSEEYLDPDLLRLGSYLGGALGLDPGPFMDRLIRTRDFASGLAQKDGVVRQAIRAAYRDDADNLDIHRLFWDSRFAEIVFQHARYSPRRYLDSEGMKIYRELSSRLRFFELLHLLRRRIVKVRERSDGQLQAKIGGRYVLLSRDTSTLDYSKPGVMENLVYRHGLMYDIKEFTSTLEKLRRQGMQKEKTAIKHMFLFHELLYQIQMEQHLRLEKFLGDGAFYTGVSPQGLLRAAVEIQTLYADLRRRGFVFDQGIRLAVNYAYYNLLPIRGGSGSPGEYSLEFHGPGLVELNRLTTGKTQSEVREFKEHLITHGYDPGAVHKFFAPMERYPRSQGLGAGEFGAFLDRYGTLVNEGIVASRALVERLSEDMGRNPEIVEMEIRERAFVGYVEGGRFYGMREMGVAKLKGLDPQRLYEIESLEGSAVEGARAARAASLLEALDRAFRKNQAQERVG